MILIEREACKNMEHLTLKEELEERYLSSISGSGCSNSDCGGGCFKECYTSCQTYTALTSK